MHDLTREHSGILKVYTNVMIQREVKGRKELKEWEKKN